MVSASPMEIHVIISGVMLLVHMRVAQITHLVIVLALQHQELGHKHQLLAAISTVNLEILLTHFLQCESLLVTDSGMGNSVKVPVAVVPSLPRGSVYSYPPKHLIGLRCVFVLMSPLVMKMS